MKVVRLVMMCILIPSISWASRSFEKIEIPGAICGDGSPYSVFVENRSNNKLAIKLQGGGACWDHFTCYTLGSARGKIPNRLSEDEGFSADNDRLSPIADYSYVYFPYCTGDVHLGAHRALYKDKVYRHNGRNNILMSIRYLIENDFVRPSDVDDFVLYGSSAGAIGALYHLKNIGAYFEGAQKKTLIADAPGLHFGDNFWYNFTDALFYDYATALGELGFNLEKDRGNIASVVPMLCQDNHTWDIGVIQATRDRVMSWVFGRTSADAHEERVLGPDGIFQLTQNPNDNCSAFTPYSQKHILMNDNRKLGIRAGGKRVIEYAYEMVRVGAGASYR